MSDLVSVAELQAFLKSGAVDDTLMGAILDGVEALLERQCNRVEAPFTASVTPVTEVWDGTGGAVLFLHYGITTLTSVKIGADASSPDETLTVADVHSVRFASGKRRLVRADGGTFGEAGDQRVVHVAYTPAADLPEDCKQAVKRVAAAVYNQLGTEGTSAQSVGGFSHSIEQVATGDMAWMLAVHGHTRIRNL